VAFSVADDVSPGFQEVAMDYGPKRLSDSTELFHRDWRGMEASTLRVIFPVGGVAKRLRPLTAETSKAAVRLLNRPLIEFPMYSLAGQGVRNFIFGVKGFLNYRCLYDYFGEGLGFSAQGSHKVPAEHPRRGERRLGEDKP